MMKINLFLLLLLSATVVQGQTQFVKIKNHPFVFSTSVVTHNGSEIVPKEVRLSRNDTQLLTHILFQTEGDCNSEVVELGTYAVKDSQIVFYSYWAKAGDAPAAPFGMRKQVYAVAENGSLNLTQSTLYIETAQEGYALPGIRYLATHPKTAEERQQLAAYIAEAETAYNASFVRGEAKEILFKEVRARLKAQIKIATKDWKRHYVRCVM